MDWSCLRKMALVSPPSGSTGDVALLNCTAIVNTSNETLTDKSAISESIHRHAGPELRDELLKLKGRGRHQGCSGVCSPCVALNTT